MNINLTIIGQSITFAFFVWFCFKYIWPPIITAMRERQAAIADGLAASERAEKDLELAQAKAGDELNAAKEQAAEIIDQARVRANQMVEEAKDDARAEGERLKEAAQAEIEQEVNRVKEGLRAQVSTLAIAGAEKVLGESVDAGKHQQLLDRLASEL